MRKFLMTFGILVSIFVMAILDRSFFPAIGGAFASINLTLTVAFYLIIIIDKNFSLLLFSSATLLSALLGNTLVVFHLLIGLVILILMDWIFESFLTNRSYYTLIILGTLGWFAYYILFSIIIGIASLFESNIILPQVSFTWISHIFFGSLVVMLLLSVAYIFTNFLSKKFRSYFIIS